MVSEHGNIEHGNMGSWKREPLHGGCDPQWGPGQGTKPPEAEAYFCLFQGKFWNSLHLN